jgi:hypothetical protein
MSAIEISQGLAIVSLAAAFLLYFGLEFALYWREKRKGAEH